MSRFRETYGPVALITGASSGIGWGFAEELAARGFDLVVTARRLDRLEELARQLVALHGVAVTPVQCDLADVAAPAMLLEATRGMDIGLVVSNAGVGLPRAVLEAHRPEDLSRLLQVNCHAPLLLANGFVPRLRERGRGGLLFTSSVEGVSGFPYSAAYASSKAMVNALAESLWGELHGAGVDVLALLPGPTISEMAAAVGIGDTYLSISMPARECARLGLDNLTAGPTWIPDETFRGYADARLARPRREWLAETAQKAATSAAT